MNSTVKRHPFRGLFSGLLLGFGLLVLLIVTGAAPFTSAVPLVLILLAGAGIGVVIGLFAPARGRRGGRTPA
jgi:hypothetical protein